MFSYFVFTCVVYVMYVYVPDYDPYLNLATDLGSVAEIREVDIKTSKVIILFTFQIIMSL